MATGLDVGARGLGNGLDILDFDHAIEALSRENETLAQVIEMRYFGRMTAEETAEVRGLFGSHPSARAPAGARMATP